MTWWGNDEAVREVAVRSLPLAPVALTGDQEPEDEPSDSAFRRFISGGEA